MAASVAFRFCFVYFSLYILCGPILGTLLVLPVGHVPGLATLPPMRNLIVWVARRIFGVGQPVAFSNTGSGDKLSDWVCVFCLLVMAILGTAAWLILDRRTAVYGSLRRWFRLVVRIGLGATMITYGVTKVIALQMLAPSLARLVEPFGNFSPMSVLWYSIGAAPPYEVFLGCVEVLTGVLLCLPPTAMLGALLCLADTSQIFVLNMAYDVPVKLASFHLLLLALFLLAPEASRLGAVFLLNQPVGRSPQPPLLPSPRGNLLAGLCQVVYCAYIVGMNLHQIMPLGQRYGNSAPKSLLYGIWEVTAMSIDGQARAPLLTDYDRWRRVVFHKPSTVHFQRMDDTFVPYTSAIDKGEHTLTLTLPDDKNWKATLTFAQPAAEELILDGDLNGHHLHMQLRLYDKNNFMLLRRGFHWVQESPFFR